MIEEIAMLDHLSHGRLEVGVGRGVSPFELKFHKVAHQDSREIFIDAYKCVSAGLITAVGAIDIIIPPSIPMIVYGSAASESVPRLYAAGILPGLLIAGAVNGNAQDIDALSAYLAAYKAPAPAYNPAAANLGKPRIVRLDAGTSCP